MEDRNANLKKLADYLDTLPDDYDAFNMRSFIRLNNYNGWGLADNREDYLLCKASLHECGSVACAVGHGPAAGICMTPLEAQMREWNGYTDRCFVDSASEAFSWMFGGLWGFADGDNTPRGAAARIRYYLDRGVPSDFIEPAITDHAIYAPYLKENLK